MSGTGELAGASPSEKLRRRRDSQQLRFKLSTKLPPWARSARRLLAPVLGVFIGCIFVVVRPISALTGQYAFLIITSQILFFFANGRILEQVENNTINFIGAVCGLAWATCGLLVAAWCGRHYGADASQVRAVMATWLAALALVCGFLRSYVPRLNVACRAALFHPIFSLTTLQKITHYDSSMFLEQFFVALFAYLISTISGVLLTEHWSSPEHGSHILKSLQTTSDLIPASLRTVLETEEFSYPSTPSITSVDPRHKPTPKAVEEQQPMLDSHHQQQNLARRLRSEIANSRASHATYAKDIVHARQHPKELVPVIHCLGRLQRNALLIPTSHVPGNRIRTALERTYGEEALTRPGTPTSVRRRTVNPLGGHSRQSSMSDLRAAQSRSQSRVSFESAATQNSPDVTRGSSTGISPVQLARKLSIVATHVVSSTPRNVSSGSQESPARAKLNKSCDNLCHAIRAALRCTAQQLVIACDWNFATVEEKDLDDPREIRVQLQVALGKLQQHLGGIIDTTEVAPLRKTTSAATSGRSTRGIVFEDEVTTADWLDDEDRFRVAFYMIAMIDLTKEIAHLLDHSIRLGSSANPQKAWIIPPVVWPWTKVRPEVPISSIEGDLPHPDLDNEDRVREEDLDFVSSLLRNDKSSRAEKDPAAPVSFVRRCARAWRSVWDEHGVVMARVAMSTFFHNLKHSRHVLFAVKNAFGISLLSLPAYMPPGNSARNWYDSTRGPWMVVSFMYVLEVTTGSTLRIGFYRACGTFLGALIGYICVLITHSNPYGLTVLATAAAVPLSYTIIFTHIAPLGTITGITLPPVLFIEYLNVAGGHSTLWLACWRFLDIFIGILAAVLIGSWIWPIHARVQYFLAVARMLDQVTEYYLRMSRDLVRPSLVYQANHRHYAAVEHTVRRHIARSRVLIEIQQREISLLPRPVKLYTEVVDLAERLFESMTEIRILRFSLPRKATVLDVLPIRRELISALLINIWACAQAFRSRSPLPQLLPSPRVPLGEVMDATDEHARHVRTWRAQESIRRQRAAGVDGLAPPDSPQLRGDQNTTPDAELAVLYGMAENEALGEAISSIDELLAAARTLFGTQSFMDPVL